MRVHERRAAPRTGIGHGRLHGLVAGQQVGAVHFQHQQIGVVAHKLGDAPAGRLHFDRHGNGIAVVFNYIDDGQLEVAGRVEGFKNSPSLVVPSPAEQ